MNVPCAPRRTSATPWRGVAGGVGAGVVIGAWLVATMGCAEPYYDDALGLDGVAVAPGSLAGTFGLQSTAVDQADVPVFGKIDTGGITASLVLRSWRGDDEEGTYDEVVEVCGVENFETAGLLTVIPPTTIHPIPTANAVLHVDHATGSHVRDTYREYWAVRGLPDDEPLPADKGSDVYWDMDDDGKPGTTVLASGLADGEIYVAQRKTIDQAGVIRSEDEAVGLSRVKKEGVVLDATSDLLKTESERTPHPDPRQSWFIEMRLPDDAGCDDVLAAQQRGDLPRRSPLPRTDP
jgi:hypothetical protein